MKLSVIIPVYNRTDTLKSAVESVLCQTYNNIEIIVVDDGSSINVQGTLLPYANLIKYIRHDENKGVSTARNTGIEASTGEYIALLDSDDLWLPFKADMQIKALEKSGLRICHTDEFWYKKDRFINKQKKHERFGGRILPYILDFCRISPSSVMFHRSVLEKTGIFDESMRVCEDYDLFLRFALFYEIEYVPTKAIIKRAVTDDQLSASIEHIESVRLGALQRFYEKYRDEIPADCSEAVIWELKRKSEIAGGRVKK